MFWGSSKYRSLKLLQAVKVINKNNEHKNNAISFNFFIVSPHLFVIEILKQKPLNSLKVYKTIITPNIRKTNNNYK